MSYDIVAADRGVSAIVGAIGNGLRQFGRRRPASGIRSATGSASAPGTASTDRARDRAPAASEIVPKEQFRPRHGLNFVNFRQNQDGTKEDRLITKALRTLLDSDAMLNDVAAEQWASARFAGIRHRLNFEVGRPIDRRTEHRLAAKLADLEFDCESCIVADATIASVSADRRTIAFEVLTVAS